MDTATLNRPSPLSMDPNIPIDYYDINDENSEMEINYITPPNSTESQYSYSPSMASPEGSIHAMSPSRFSSLDKPRLVIREQPVDKFRFRYKSEMAGTHGCLNGRTSDKSRKVTFPTVELLGYKGTAKIRCSIYTADESRRYHHPHRLMKDDQVDPHDIEVGPNLGYEAVFSNMGIIHTAKKHVPDEMKRKKERLWREQKAVKKLTLIDEAKIKKEVEDEIRCLNLNTVCLCFEAFKQRSDGILELLCDPVFSDPINNSKSAMTGELKICRMSTAVSSCLGGEEVFLLVEKVVKKNIRVRFFELDESGEVTVWQDYGHFTDLDVHHQYAIVLKTPPYRDTKITNRVEVFVELERISDGDRSEPKTFTYKPDLELHSRRVGGKRRRIEIPVTVDSLNNSASSKVMRGPECLEVLNDCVDGIDSEDFKNFLEGLPSGDLETFLSSSTNSSTSLLTTDGPKLPRTDNSNCKLRSILKPNVDVKKVQMENIQSSPHQFVNKIIRLLATVPPQNPQKIRELCKMTLNAGESVLHVALENNMINETKILMKILKEYGTSNIINICNDNGETLLHRAVQCGLLDVVEELISMNVNPNIPDNNGDTALHLLLKSKHSNEKIVKIMEQLLKTTLHFEPDFENDDGLTPLHLSIKRNLFEAVKLLIEAGADVNHICRRDGDAALHMAVEENNTRILEYLLQASNANVNQQNFGGYTPLHKAVVEDNKELCLLLRNHNADPNIPNHIKVEVKEEITDEEEECTGMTSIQLALHNKDILNILKKELPSPSIISEVHIKEEEEEAEKDEEEVEKDEEDEDLIDDSKDLFSLDEYNVETLASFCDENKFWVKLADYLNCDNKFDVYKEAVSPTKAVIYDQKNSVTKPMIREFLEIIKENFIDDDVDHAVNELIKQLKLN